MNHIDTFAGIGGFSLAARWMGWKTIATCEIDTWNQKVLRYHFPEADHYGDITQTDFTQYADITDILTGGFPCQPYSIAGERKGTNDERHLWPQMLRVIRQSRPRWVVGENVRGLINWSDGLVFDQVQIDLETEGYKVQPFLLPAAGVNAPHERYRIWFVAYSDKVCTLSKEDAGNGIPAPIDWDTIVQTSRQGGEQPSVFDYRLRNLCGQSPVSWSGFPTESVVSIGNDGIPKGLDPGTFPVWRQKTLEAMGNAIVPQVAYQIFKAIDEFEKRFPQE